jgi:outer membrane lipase/esterase
VTPFEQPWASVHLKAFAADGASVWTNICQQIQQLLAPAANAGTRIFLFDYETLQARIVANPGQYGFAGAAVVSFLSIPGCFAASIAVQNSFFSWDTVHPTGAGFALIARFMSNQIDAPLTVGPQADVAMSAATSFEDAVFGSLTAIARSHRMAWAMP